MRRAHPLTIVLAMSMVAACTGEATTTTTATTTSTTTPPATSTTTTPAPTQPDVQAQVAWFVAVLNGTDITSETYDMRFGPEFRAQVPFDTAFQAILAQFRPIAPYKIIATDGTATRGETIIEAADGTRLRILAEVDSDNVITTLFIQPTEIPELDNPPETVDEAFARLSELGRFRAITAELSDGACVPLDTVSADEPAPIGSVFKLYVLAAVGEAVNAGDIAWADMLTVRDELKSIPTGDLQNRPDGETVSVLDVAELMISISDNTAADHLIDAVGRDTVESIQAEYGNTTPELNRPFLNTREFAALKVGPGSGLRDPQWIEGDEAIRRSLLAQLADISTGDLPIADWLEPIDPHLVEWFATPTDLCTLAAGLLELADTTPEIDDILSINPGVPADNENWDRIWFKGGSEPGLVAAWWMTEADGRVFVTAGSVVDPDALIATDEAILLLAAARDLLAP